MKIQPTLAGSVTHPKDLMPAARQEMNEEQLKVFLEKYGRKFTAEDLIKHLNEEIRKT